MLWIYERLSDLREHCKLENRCVDVVYPNVVASGDHVSQFVLAARSGAKVVADWLVSLPPRPPGIVQYNVLIWRGDLSNTEGRHYRNYHF